MTTITLLLLSIKRRCGLIHLPDDFSALRLAKESGNVPGFDAHCQLF
jgi:hypothetical protein